MFTVIKIKGMMDYTYDIIAEVIREYDHGFNSKLSWGLYKTEEDETLATFIDVRKKGFRRITSINKRYVISMVNIDKNKIKRVKRA